MAKGQAARAVCTTQERTCPSTIPTPKRFGMREFPVFKLPVFVAPLVMALAHTQSYQSRSPVPPITPIRCPLSSYRARMYIFNASCLLVSSTCTTYNSLEADISENLKKTPIISDSDKVMRMVTVTCASCCQSPQHLSVQALRKICKLPASCTAWVGQPTSLHYTRTTCFRASEIWETS